MPSTQVVPAATEPMEVRAPPTHIDQVVEELHTIEPGVQDPEAGAGGAGASVAADG